MDSEPTSRIAALTLPTQRQAHGTNRKMPPISWHATTILTIRKGGRVVIAGDGQVSLGQTVIKSNARKVRPLARAT